MVIVVGVDESEQAAEAVRRAVAYARRWEAELHVVHVTHISGAVLAALEQVPQGLAELREAQQRMVWERIDPLLAGLAGAKRVELDGYPPDTLVAYAQRVGADLIVVGNRGRGELASLVLGSTSHRVSHIARCDVLIVKARGEES